MWKSTVIEGWRIEGRRDMLVEQVRARYPNLAPELLERIKATTDSSAIQRWSIVFATAADQATFEAALVNGANNDKPQT